MNSEWLGKTEWHCDSVRGLDCVIWIESRPAYCDRGNFIAKIELGPTGDRLRLDIDDADGWPRYYMDLGRAKLEVEDWMRKRKQWVG